MEKETSIKSTIRDIIRKHFEKAYDYLLSGVSYESILTAIEFEVRNSGLNPSLIPEEIAAAQAEFEDHFLLHGVPVKEGDILLLFDTHALGDLAYPMVGIENLMGHAAMVVSKRWGPIKSYYVAEVLDKIATSKITDYPQSVVLRPKGFSLAGKTEAMMNRIQSRPFRFDSRFKDGLFDEEGSSFSLYCAEFIHYAFKNGFDHRAGDQPSP